MNKTSLVILLGLMLAGCAGDPPAGIGAAMHAENNVQVGWKEQPIEDGSTLYIVASPGNVSYADMAKVAEAHARAHCQYGYRVLSLDGNDQPQVDSLNARFILSSEVRLKVRCFDKETEIP
jgi:hypothetical protein